MIGFKTTHTYSCSRCGGKIERTTRVCPHCGTHLSGTANQQPAKRYIHCPRCNEIWDGMLCGKCGNTQWTIVIPWTLFGVLLVLAAAYPIIGYYGFDPLGMIPENSKPDGAIVISTIIGGISILVLSGSIGIFSRRRKILKKLGQADRPR